jgi:hypothetical protein
MTMQAIDTHEPRQDSRQTTLRSFGVTPASQLRLGEEPYEDGV